MKTLFFILNILVCGLCLGFLNGISASPILQVAFTSIITFFVSILIILSGTNNKESDFYKKDFIEIIQKIQIFPLTIFLIFYTLGACIGIFTKTNDLLGTQPNILYERWKNYGLKKEKVIEKINRSEDVLLHAEFSICDILKNKHGKELRNELLSIDENDYGINLKIIEKADSSQLEKIKETICEK